MLLLDNKLCFNKYRNSVCQRSFKCITSLLILFPGSIVSVLYWAKKLLFDITDCYRYINLYTLCNAINWEYILELFWVRNLIFKYKFWFFNVFHFQHDYKKRNIFQCLIYNFANVFYIFLLKRFHEHSVWSIRKIASFKHWAFVSLSRWLCIRYKTEKKCSIKIFLKRTVLFHHRSNAYCPISTHSLLTNISSSP